jgi:hypothetical protein
MQRQFTNSSAVVVGVVAFARYKGKAEKTLIAAGFPRLYTFRSVYIYRLEPRNEPNLSYRLLRAIYPAFECCFPIR